MDPNWFYSTLAQSTAAIVGLAGAFLVQRLIAQREEIGPLRQGVRERCQALVQQIAGNVQEADAVLQSLDAALTEADQAVRAGTPVTVTGNVSMLGPEGGASGQIGLPEPQDFDGLAILQDARTAVQTYRDTLASLTWETAVEQIREHGALLPAPADWLNDPGPRPGQQAVPPMLAMWARLEAARFEIAPRWAQLREQSRAYGSELAGLRARLVPASFYVLLAILAALLLASVIAPLTFLTAEDGPSKPILLAFFTPLSIAFVAYFGYELRRLRRADRLAPDAF